MKKTFLLLLVGFLIGCTSVVASNYLKKDIYERDINDAVVVAMDGDVINGKNVVDNRLVVGKTVWRVERIITVGNTVPTKVEMKHPVAVVTVADESV